MSIWCEDCETNGDIVDSAWEQASQRLAEAERLLHHVLIDAESFDLSIHKATLGEIRKWLSVSAGEQRG